MGSPWITRFGGDMADADIVDRVLVSGTPLQGLSSDAGEITTRRIEAAFKSLFVPTTQVVSALKKLRHMALAYSAHVYPDMPQFIRSIYSRQRAEPIQFPCCLTGLGGVGKSALLGALSKVMPEEIDVDIPNHGVIQATSMWGLIVRPRAGSSGVLELSVPHTTAAGESEPSKPKLDPRVAYRAGVGLITVDEFQAITGSNANTLASKTLLQLAQVGPPLVFCANYSLVHSLMRRPQQDRQRLLSDPLIIHPELADSEDWIRKLKGFIGLAPGIFRFSPIQDGPTIHRYTGGIKRSVSWLLITAYRIMRETGKPVVDIFIIRSAYEHVGYATHRADVEMLIRQAIEKRPCGRNDLWCPFPTPPQSNNVVIATSAITHHQQKINELLVRSSLTPEERSSYDYLKNDVSSSQKRKASVVTIRRKPATKEDLIAGHQAFQSESLDDSS